MKQEEIVVKIEKIVPNGYGLAFVDGMTIFVSLAVKGDTLKVRLREKKGKLAFAEVIEVIEAAPERIVPNCKYFGKCGGCDFQQMSYPAQLEATAKAQKSAEQDLLAEVAALRDELAQTKNSLAAVRDELTDTAQRLEQAKQSTADEIGELREHVAECETQLKEAQAAAAAHDLDLLSQLLRPH
ncbi:MAG TPA: hypothetical protein PKY82_31525, partial [Pyrinomonadaceae bacterium]|nr:hypothetical protein [Pyrinomonadaceae bacterium]